MPIRVGVIVIAGLLGCRLLFCYLLCSCPPDIKATGRADEWFHDKTAVEMARHKGHSDIVEFLNTYQPQPRGELHCLSVVWIMCVGDYIKLAVDQLILSVSLCKYTVARVRAVST